MLKVVVARGLLQRYNQLLTVDRESIRAKLENDEPLTVAELLAIQAAIEALFQVEGETLADA